jgi:hypothetical protein
VKPSTILPSSRKLQIAELGTLLRERGVDFEQQRHPEKPGTGNPGKHIKIGALIEYVGARGDASRREMKEFRHVVSELDQLVEPARDEFLGRAAHARLVAEPRRGVRSGFDQDHLVLKRRERVGQFLDMDILSVAGLRAVVVEDAQPPHGRCRRGRRTRRTRFRLRLIRPQVRRSHFPNL